MNALHNTKNIIQQYSLKKGKVNIILLGETNDKYHKPAVLKVLLLQNTC